SFSPSWHSAAFSPVPVPPQNVWRPRPREKDAQQRKSSARVWDNNMNPLNLQQLSMLSFMRMPLGVSPFGIDPQVTDHSVEGPTVPGSIAMTQGKKQLWQSIGGRHGSLACRDHYLKQMFSCMSQETFYC